MIEDDVVREVRAVREAYARMHHFDVRAMVADLQTRNLAGDWPVVRHSPRRCQSVQSPFSDEELQRRRQQRAGRPLTEILERLERSCDTP